MQLIPNSLQKAQDEVRRGAHNQDLFEVPKKAELDREHEAQELRLPPPPTTPKQS